jgi:hypothetical protein
VGETSLAFDVPTEGRRPHLRLNILRPSNAMNPLESDFSASSPHLEAAEVSHLAIETVAEITRTSRHLIVVYCRHGLIQPVANPDESGWIFDEEVIHRLRRIESLRTQFGMNLEGVRMYLELSNELDALRNELRFWRAR